jgi:hypothetical protein
VVEKMATRGATASACLQGRNRKMRETRRWTGSRLRPYIDSRGNCWGRRNFWLCRPSLHFVGGATALEGNSGQAGPQAAAAGAGIRTFLFLINFCSGVWKKIPWLLFLFFLEKRELFFSMSIRSCL